MTDNGRWVLFAGRLASGEDGAFLVDLGLGTPYCTATPNSTGLPGELAVTGYDAAGGQPLRLVSSQLPPEQFGYFLTGLTPGNQPNPGGSQGTLCLSGNIGRYNGQVASSGRAGYLELGVDTTSMPVNPPTAVLVGQTWHFQLWHRDLNPTLTSNFTHGVALTFQ